MRCLIFWLGRCDEGTFLRAYNRLCLQNNQTLISLNQNWSEIKTEIKCKIMTTQVLDGALLHAPKFVSKECSFKLYIV